MTSNGLQNAVRCGPSGCAGVEQEYGRSASAQPYLRSPNFKMTGATTYPTFRGLSKIYGDSQFQADNQTSPAGRIKVAKGTTDVR